MGGPQIVPRILEEVPLIVPLVFDGAALIFEGAPLTLEGIHLTIPHLS